MTLAALALALLAAVLHAAWNLVVKSSDDQLVAAWTVVAGAALLALPVLAYTGLPDSAVWDLLLISTVVQVIYVLFLALAYRLGDLSFVYPMARGTSPVLVSLAGVLFLGDEISALGWLGVLTVTTALTFLAWSRVDRSGLWAALATGLMISAYTSIDAAAVREQGDAVSVIAAEFVLLAVTLGLVVLAVRGPVAMLGMVRSRLAQGRPRQFLHRDLVSPGHGGRHERPGGSGLRGERALGADRGGRLPDPPPRGGDPVPGVDRGRRHRRHRPHRHRLRTIGFRPPGASRRRAPPPTPLPRLGRGVADQHGSHHPRCVTGGGVDPGVAHVEHCRRLHPHAGVPPPTTRPGPAWGRDPRPRRPPHRPGRRSPAPPLRR